MLDKNELRFFGRRKGKTIKSSKQQLIDELLPRLKPSFEGKSKGQVACQELFSFQPQECWLEIGFGGGEHVAELAMKYQNVGFFAAEPFINGVASLLAHLNGSHEGKTMHTGLDEARSDNVRIWDDDVREVFPYFQDGAFKKVFLLYPDPWPKARHAERRFTNQINQRHLYRLMSEDALFYVATDVKEYAEWTLEQVEMLGLFEQVNEDTSIPPEDWVATRYEKKGILAGRKPIYLVFQKKKHK